MTWRQLGISLSAALGIAFVYLLWSWQPEQQVRRHFETLLVEMEERNWKRAGHEISEQYADEWGLTKSQLLESANEALRQFIWMTIRPVEPGFSRPDSRTVIVTTRLQLDGRGTGLAQAGMDRVNGLSQPFGFTWRKEGAWPWDWKLASIRQSELNLQAVPWE